MGFWQAYLDTGGLEWPDDFAARLDPGLELQEHVARHLSASPDGGPQEILDVGAGPLTVLGKVWAGSRLSVCAVDPLAPVYDRLLAEAGIVPAVRTIEGTAENLGALFPARRFDLTYARNCLDHAADPVVAIREMFAVTRAGGRVVLEHAVNEGVTQGYRGLHQWNFELDGSALRIWRPGTSIVFDPRSHGGECVEARTDAGWMLIAYRRA